MTSPESRSTLAQQLRWESKAALSAADFADRYAIDCCRHAEAVSECAHCTLRFLASFTRRAVDALTSGTPEPADITCATCAHMREGQKTLNDALADAAAEIAVWRAALTAVVDHASPSFSRRDMPDEPDRIVTRSRRHEALQNARKVLDRKPWEWIGGE
jgi:hypothetical protein